MRFSNSGSIASGVTSRPVKPVPPVVMMASTSGSAIHLLMTMRIASTSSTTISRAASRWPAATRRSPSVAPDLSSSSERVSEIVSTAMLSGRKVLDSSMEDMTCLSSRPACAGHPRLTGLPEARTWMAGTSRPRRSMPIGYSSPARTERIAGLHRALLIAGHEPLLSLRRGAMREGIRHHPSGRLPLQRVVADRRGRCQRGIDVARFQEARTFLLLAVDPDARQAIRLQLDLHLQRVGFRLAAGLLLQPRHPRQDAEQVLDVMTGFMGNDIGRGEFAGIARAAVKPGLDLAEESGVEKYLLVRRTIKRSHRRLRHAAASAIGGVAEQHDLRTDIGLSAGAEDFAPAIVDFTQDAGDHVAHLVGRRAGLGGRGSPIGLIGRRLAATAIENFRAADQKPRVDAERITDQAEHDDGADAEAAAADRKAHAAATAHSAATVVTTVFDVVAATEIIVTHGAV